MKKWLLVILVLSLVGTAALAATTVVPVAREKSLLKTLLSTPSRAELSSGTVVGSEFCLACHAPYGNVANWRDTKHSHALRKPMGMYTLIPGEGVLANSLGAAQDDFMVGLDFNALSGTPFDSVKPNAPILSYRASDDTYWIQLGPTGLKMQVVATWAGMTPGNGQRYMVRIPVSDLQTGQSAAIYFPPLSWSGTAWSASLSSWYTGSTPKYAPGVTSVQLGSGLQSQNYLATCSGCHITGVRKAFTATSGERVVNPYPASLVPDNSPDYPDLDGDGLPDCANIGCESCHGPGSAHILGGGDPAKIVNPADITNNQKRSTTCLQCHVQIASAPTKYWGFTYNETANTGFFMTHDPPADLSSYQVFTGGKWPDGVHYVSARIDSYYSADHYIGAHGIACNDCHDPHSETMNDSQVRDSITRSGITYNNVSADDDSFCMACHHAPYFLPSANITGAMVKAWKAPGFDAPIPDNIRDAIESHSNHPYGATRELGLSRCLGCHMAPESGHGDVSGYSHTFWPSRPEDTLTYKAVTGLAYGGTGNVNSCASSCHRNQVRIWTDINIDNSSPNNQFGQAYMSGASVGLANYLVQYFGPDGLWWKTASDAPAVQTDWQ